MQLLVRVTDETAAYLYRYFKQIVDEGHHLAVPISEYAQAYTESYEQELKRLEGVEKNLKFERIKD